MQLGRLQQPSARVRPLVLDALVAAHLLAGWLQKCGGKLRAQPGREVSWTPARIIREEKGFTAGCQGVEEGRQS